jgi:hypothetical protein
MAEICWFCKKNIAQSDAYYECYMHKVIKKDYLLQEKKEKVKITYHPIVLRIPRCQECLPFQKKIKKTNSIGTWAGILFIGIGYVIAGSTTGALQVISFIGFGLLGVISIIGVRMLTKHQCQTQGTTPESAYKKHPEIIKALGAGYVYGDEPGSPSSS